MKKLEVANYFKPPSDYKKNYKKYLIAIENDENEIADEYLEKMAGKIGITYTSKSKKIDGKVVEFPYTEFDSFTFVNFLHNGFKAISIAGNIAFYNYVEHHFDFVAETVYLSFFKEILDEIDADVWTPNREKEYAKRFIRGIPSHFANWEIPKGKIIFNNGVLDIITDKFVEGHDTEVINFHSTGYDFPKDTLMDCPKFKKFLNSIFDDPALIDVNQEMAGATLMYGLPLEKIFLQHGTGRNGKGVLDHIITLIHGVDCVSTASVSQLSSRFGAAMIYDKVLNISTENDMDFLVDTSLLKAVSGNDYVTIDQKYEKSFQAKVSCKLIISTNEIVFRDRSRGFEERLVAIPFEYTFVDNPKGPKERKKNPNLEAELLEEIPAIFLWAYEGYKRLRDNNWQFTQCEKVDRLREEILRDANPVAIFFEDCIQTKAGARTKKSDVYDHFENWANKKRVNVGGIISRQKFYSEFGRILDSQGLSHDTVTITGTQYFKDIIFEKI